MFALPTRIFIFFYLKKIFIADNYKLGATYIIVNSND